jgi:hypothetical protein
LLYNYRSRAAREREMASVIALRDAEQAVAELGQLELRVPPDMIPELRTQQITRINNAVDAVLANTSDASEPAVRAEAILTRADMYWLLANAPSLPGAATRPSLNPPEPRETYLEKAAADYNAIITAYPKQIYARVSAQFGLAAIAENRRDFEGAARLYQSISDDATVPDVFRNQAQARMKLIPEMQKPLMRGPFNVEPEPSPTTEPATLPSTIAAPTTAPSDVAPSTNPSETSPSPQSPAAPTTEPSAEPATRPSGE